MSEGLLIVQSGGPTPVSNTILAATVQKAIADNRFGKKIYGARGGIYGLLAGDLIDLGYRQRWDTVADSPGAALGSSRYRPSAEEIGLISEILDKKDIGNVLFIGGNGTMQAAIEVWNVAGSSPSFRLAYLPDTVDNDVYGTDFSAGYGSCARYSAQVVLDVAADVRSLPTPVSVIEVMGRNAGWIAAATAVVRDTAIDAPHRIYLPEVSAPRDQILGHIQDTYDKLGWVVIVVAEGVVDGHGTPLAISTEPSDPTRHGGAMAGDAGAAIARMVTVELGLRARSEKPGLIARTSMGHRSPADIEHARAAGRFAVDRLHDGEGGFLVAASRESGDFCHVEYVGRPLDKIDSGERKLPNDFIDPTDGQPNNRFCRYAAPLVGPFTGYPTLNGGAE